MKKYHQATTNSLQKLAVAMTAMIALSATPLSALANGGSSGGGLPAAQSGPRVDPAESFRQGMNALEALDYRKAEKKFKEVLSVAPKHPEANYYMGIAKIGRGKEKSSVRYFKRAIKARDGFVEAREQLALISVKLDDRKEAEAQLAALKAMKTSCAESECSAALVERYDLAIANIEAALDGEDTEADDVSAAPAKDRFSGLFLHPREVGVDRYRDAVKLINQERYEEAIEDLYHSQAIIGPHPDILNYLGYTHRKINKFDKAKSYYAQALDLAPDHLGANEYLGELYLELGEMKQAKRQLARLDSLCAFGCAEREDLARLIAIRETIRRADR